MSTTPKGKSFIEYELPLDVLRDIHGGLRFVTLSLREEGGATTMAVGEEGGGGPTTMATGEESGGAILTTLALGEEGCR